MGIAATTPSAMATSQRRLAPDMNSVPARIDARTSDVPRSGWSITRASGGPISRQAPRMEPSESSLPSRLPRYVARTMIMRIFASSENWNVTGPNLTQRAEPPTPSPIASVSTSSARLTA